MTSLSDWVGGFCFGCGREGYGGRRHRFDSAGRLGMHSLKTSKRNTRLNRNIVIDKCPGSL